MGQKVNPISLRLGIVRGWESNWYGGKEFGEKLAEDNQIRKYLNARMPRAGISKILIERMLKRIIITVHTSRPGIVIGKGGSEVDKLKEEVKKLTKKDVQINIFEVKRPELNAELVGQNIASQLVKKMAYRRVLNKTMQSTMRMGAEGIRINVAGRLGGVEIARSERFMDGRVPLHTLRADIDYALVEAHTTYGIIGIKVWICNGFNQGKK